MTSRNNILVCYNFPNGVVRTEWIDENLYKKLQDTEYRKHYFNVGPFHENIGEGTISFNCIESSGENVMAQTDSAEQTEVMFNDSDCAADILLNDEVPLDNEKEIFEELLINEVYARPPLWNHSIDVKLRAPDIVARLWQEIANNLGVELGLCKKRWKSLRNTYSRKLAEQKKYVRSGSGSDAAPKMEKWAFFELLEFLKPTIGYRRTFTNKSLSKPTSTVEQGANTNRMSNTFEHEDFDSRSITPQSTISTQSSCINKEHTSSRKRRRLNLPDTSGFEGALLESINRTCEPKDEVATFANFLESRMRALQPKYYAQLSHRFMSELMEIERQQAREASPTVSSVSSCL